MARIEEYPEAMLVYGSIDGSLLAEKIRGIPEAISNQRLARIAGADIAIGSPTGCRRLAAALFPGFRQRVMAAYSDRNLPSGSWTWLLYGELDSPSQSMFFHLTQTAPVWPVPSLDASPCTAVEFRRCALLLEAVPALSGRLHHLPALSARWAAIVNSWPVLMASLRQEAPSWRNGVGECPVTNALITRIRKDPEAFPATLEAAG